MATKFSIAILEEIRRTFSYDPQSGVFTRIDGKGRRSRRLPGAKPSYPQIRVGAAVYYCHIVAWWMMTGEAVPAGFEIDHKDRNPTNCQWRNLRLATSTENKLNTGIRRTNKSGTRGVSSTSSGTWDARIRIGGKIVLLGRHKTIEAAIAARRDAEIQYFGAPLADVNEARCQT